MDKAVQGAWRVWGVHGSGAGAWHQGWWHSYAVQGKADPEHLSTNVKHLPTHRRTCHVGTNTRVAGALALASCLQVVGPVLTLAGYPPFQVAASEILHLGPAGGAAGGGGACDGGGAAAGVRGQGAGLWGKKGGALCGASCGVSREAVEAAMARFLRTEQRFGK